MIPVNLPLQKKRKRKKKTKGQLAVKKWAWIDETHTWQLDDSVKCENQLADFISMVVYRRTIFYISSVAEAAAENRLRKLRPK